MCLFEDVVVFVVVVCVVFFDLLWFRDVLIDMIFFVFVFDFIGDVGLFFVEIVWVVVFGGLLVVVINYFGFIVLGFGLLFDLDGEVFW